MEIGAVMLLNLFKLFSFKIGGRNLCGFYRQFYRPCITLGAICNLLEVMDD